MMRRLIATAALTMLPHQMMAQAPSVYCEFISSRDVISLNLAEPNSEPLRLSFDNDIDPAAKEKLFGRCVDRRGLPSVLTRVETLMREHQEIQRALSATQRVLKATIAIVNASGGRVETPPPAVPPIPPPPVPPPPRTIHCTSQKFGDIVHTNCY